MIILASSHLCRPIITFHRFRARKTQIAPIPKPVEIACALSLSINVLNIKNTTTDNNPHIIAPTIAERWGFLLLVIVVLIPSLNILVIQLKHNSGGARLFFMRLCAQLGASLSPAGVSPLPGASTRSYLSHYSSSIVCPALSHARIRSHLLKIYLPS